jgi:GDPmannose 4,6-dehydratase
VEVDPRYFRPSEVDILLGDSALARKELGWTPEWTIDAMIKDMVASDLHEYKQKKILKEHGYEIEQQYE